jgi:hypothetical protein
MTTTHQHHTWPAAGEQHRSLDIYPAPDGRPTIATRYNRPGHPPCTWPVTITPPGLTQLIELAEAAQTALTAAHNSRKDASHVGDPGAPTREQYDAACGTVHMADVNGCVEFVSIHVRTLRIIGVGLVWVADVFTNYARGNYKVCLHTDAWREVVDTLKTYQD